MLAERVKQWTRQWEQQGLEKGLQEGLQKGRQEGLQQGEAQVLEKVLSKRYGPLPEWAKAKLRSAEVEQLERWAERLFDADTLEALFSE